MKLTDEEWAKLDQGYAQPAQRYDPKNPPKVMVPLQVIRVLRTTRKSQRGRKVNAARMAKYIDGMTFEEALQAGLSVQQVFNDHKAGRIVILTLFGQMRELTLTSSAFNHYKRGLHWSQRDQRVVMTNEILHLQALLNRS